MGYKKLFLRVNQDLLAHASVVLLWQLITQLIGFIFSTPLFSWFANYIVTATGSDVISNYDILRFAISPEGILFCLVIVSLVTTFYIAQFAGYCWIAGFAINRRSITIQGVIEAVTVKLFSLLQLSLLMVVRIVLLCLTIAAFLSIIAWITLSEHDINYYLTVQPREWQILLGISIFLCAVLVCSLLIQFVRWGFAIPALMFSNIDARTALKTTSIMLQGRLAFLLKLLLIWASIVGFAMLLFLSTGHYLTDRILDWAGLEPQRVLPLVTLFIILAIFFSYLFSAILFAGIQFLTMYLYYEQIGNVLPINLQRHEVNRKKGAALYKLVLNLTLVLTILCGGVIGYLINSLDEPESVLITGHRGSPLQAPENTLAAIHEAWKNGADFVEIDVQRTRDGEIIVLHDGDLMRIANDPRKVQDLTLAEIKAINIISDKNSKYTKEHVPTLKEMINYARDKVKLNIELKYNINDDQLAINVIRLLQTENFIDQTVITSLNYHALQQVKSIDPHIQTGFIIVASLGNITNSKTDFISVNQSLITSSLVDMARVSGKKVHAWTVNTPEAMLRMIECDVDNIITDNPALLREIIVLRNSLSSQEQMGLRLRTLFTNSPTELTKN